MEKKTLNKRVSCGRKWIKDTVMYQIYPQSFHDSNGDGIGDLPGIIEKLDYIKSLGVNLLWLNPCFDSPFLDAGYDVRDFYKIAPRYGTNQDMEKLFDEAHKHGIRVCLDLVAGHTSVECEWFKKSADISKSNYDRYYIWTNDWSSKTEFGNWINGYASRNGKFLINFFWSQPALNYGYLNPNPEHPWEELVDGMGPQTVIAELKNIMKYWLDMGCDGFRVDMASSLIKNDPEKEAVCKLWRENLNRWVRENYPHAVMIAEWGNPAQAVGDAGFDIDFFLHCGVPGYAEMFLNHSAVCGRKTDGNCFFSPSGTGSPMPFINEYLKHSDIIRGKGFIGLVSANHDFQRMNWGRTWDELKVIYTFIFTWPGIPVIYYGDEIGMRFMPELPSKEGGYTRTGTRTPMQWDNSPNAGFSEADKSRLYLPIDPGEDRPIVEVQEHDADSLLNHIRKLIGFRQKHNVLGNNGKFKILFAENNKYPLIYHRFSENENFLIALNPSNTKTKKLLSREFTKYEAIFVKECEIRDTAVGIELSMESISFGIFRCKRDFMRNSKTSDL